MATPPTTAKSTLFATSAANNFSNWEKLSGWELIFGDLSNECVELIEPPERIATGWIAAHYLADRLLHWFDAIVHQPKLNRIDALPSTVFHPKITNLTVFRL